MTVPPPPAAGPGPPPPLPLAGPRPVARRGVLHALLRRRRTVVALVVVLLYVTAGLTTLSPPLRPLVDRLIATPVGNTYDPPRLGPPSVWLGTDIQGRSVLYRTAYGCRTALILTFGTALLSVGLGTILGVVSGYFGGRVDAIVTWLFTTVSSIPWILLVVAIAYALQGYTFDDGSRLRDRFGDLPAIICALGLTDWVGLCRLLRGETLKLRDADYVQAARALGVGTPGILWRHVLPNVRHLILITFGLSAVGYVQAEVALTFIGIGISDKPSWGRMITDAKLEVLRGVWWQLAAATTAIFAISLALNVVGDALRDALDPKLRGRE